ncbi:MAG: thiol peroxidase [Desulfosalsimonadaceae bacterium]
MAEVTLKGKTVRTNGQLPEIGSAAPDFLLVSTALKDVRLSDFTGKNVIMNIFPSLETRVCAESIRRFNEMADSLDNTEVLCISRDLPFAHERFNVKEGIDNVVSLSEMRSNDFGDRYGLRILDGPFAGLLSRAVVVIDENHRVIYTQMVEEISEEPDYESAVAAVVNADAAVSAQGSGDTVAGASGDEFCTKMPTGEHARLSDEDEACDDGRSGKI